jgi:hypothetical protein
LFARHAEFAGARFKVGYQCGMRDEGPVAAAAWASYVGRSVKLRVEVVAEVALTLKAPLASRCSRCVRRGRVPGALRSCRMSA